MPFNFRLNLQSVFRRLGIQSGARLPQLEDDVRMVMIVTDLSRLIPAPIEPRGFAGANLVDGTALFPVFQLQSLAGGGIFIETLYIRGSAPQLADNYLIDVSETDLGLAAAVQLNIGGTPTFSRATAGSFAAPPGGANIPSPAGFSVVSLDVGIFVPNQFFFSIRSSNTIARLDISIIWRELPSIEEVG